jgi:hypothetical protein
MHMTTTTKTLPAYVQFCNALKAEAESQGLGHYLTADTETGLPQNAGYAFLRFSENGAAIIVPKSQTRMANVHSHVDLSGQDGFVALPKYNGRVLCHFAPDVTLLAPVLCLFNGQAKRPIAYSQKTVAATVAAPVQKSWAPTEEEADLILGVTH